LHFIFNLFIFVNIFIISSIIKYIKSIIFKYIFFFFLHINLN
jgi:hypothetical protein